MFLDQLLKLNEFGRWHLWLLLFLRLFSDRRQLFFRSAELLPGALSGVFADLFNLLHQLLPVVDLLFLDLLPLEPDRLHHDVNPVDQVLRHDALVF